VFHLILSLVLVVARFITTQTFRRRGARVVGCASSSRREPVNHYVRPCPRGTMEARRRQVDTSARRRPAGVELTRADVHGDNVVVVADRALFLFIVPTDITTFAREKGLTIAYTHTHTHTQGSKTQ